MADKKHKPANAALVVIAVIVTTAALANLTSAVRTDSVWVPPARGGSSLVQVERSSEPLGFYVVLGGNVAIAAYMIFALWRRYRRRRLDFNN
jgi:hypothetical protein